jgi:hypothetical protein
MSGQWQVGNPGRKRTLILLVLMICSSKYFMTLTGSVTFPSFLVLGVTTSPHFSTFQFQAIAKVTVVTKVGQKTNDIDEQSVDTARRA